MSVRCYMFHAKSAKSTESLALHFTLALEKSQATLRQENAEEEEVSSFPLSAFRSLFLLPLSFKFHFAYIFHLPYNLRLSPQYIT